MSSSTHTRARGGDSPARTIFHVDMDAFFASIEIRDNPALVGQPVLVGGTGARGVIAAASYAARSFGCRSAQPTALARRRCPHAVIISPRHGYYGEVSRQVFEVFRRFAPEVEPLSIDEAFIDMTGTERLHGPPRVAAERLRAAVRAETGLTCSVGIATRKFIAKIASAEHKPDGLTIVAPGRELEFLAPLPIGRLWGVGPRARERLEARDVHTIGELRQVAPARLRRWFGEHGAQLHRLANAVDARGVSSIRVAKSIGHEDTFARDVVGRAALLEKILSQATRVADRLDAHGLRGRRVSLKIRDHHFRTESRQRTLDRPTAQARVIYRAARDLLDALGIEGRRFRLTGVSVSRLERADAPLQQALSFAQPDALAGAGSSAGAGGRGEKLQGVLSAVRRKFGHQALYPADAGRGERPGATGASTHRPEIDDV